jgi:predicted lipid-binding transport protein (Tim44 family)
VEDRYSAALAVAAVAVALVGCGGGGGGSSSSSSDDARAVTENFVKAFGAGDGKTACTLLTPEGQAAFVKQVGGPLKAKDCVTAVEAAHGEAAAELNLDFAGASVQTVSVKGDTATATVAAHGRSLPAKLSKTGGSWKLTAVPGL